MLLLGAPSFFWSLQNHGDKPFRLSVTIRNVQKVSAEGKKPEAKFVLSAAKRVKASDSALDSEK